MEKKILLRRLIIGLLLMCIGCYIYSLINRGRASAVLVSVNIVPKKVKLGDSAIIFVTYKLFDENTAYPEINLSSVKGEVAVTNIFSLQGENEKLFVFKFKPKHAGKIILTSDDIILPAESEIEIFDGEIEITQ